MYEAFFGLRKRPYAAAPDASVLVGTPAVTDAAARLDRCVRQGRGIGVLTAAAGMGKTQLCHWLAREWGGDFRAVVLPNAGFPTRRGLLQSVLAELDEPYQRLAEAELRLQLTSVARNLKDRGTAIVLLFDEAHRHSERILEEVRLIANLIDDGEPLIRVVLAGQMELEEKLAEPALSGLNDRVGELVTLPRFTAEESRRYLRDRAASAGGDLDALFQPAAVEVVVQACGGVPRCLNQLADHGLLLGYVAERRPVDAVLVREALDDLKRLPLHWHDPLPTAEPFDQTPVRGLTGPFPESGFDETVEIGGLSDSEGMGDFDPSGSHGTRCAAGTPAAAEASVEAPETQVFRTVDSLSDLPKGRLPMAETETIRDRFARLDADDARRRWAELVEQTSAGEELSPIPTRTAVAYEPAMKRQASPLEILDRIEPLIAEALNESAFGRIAQAANRGGGFDGPNAKTEAVTRGEDTVEAAAGAEASPPPAVQADRFRRSDSTLFRDLRRRARTRGDR